VANPDFWRGRRVLLTGHTGFKGAWLALWLQQLGAQVTGFALAPATRPSLFELARVGEGMRSVTGDVRDLAALTHCVEEARPEVVLHLAAQALVRPSYEDPVGTWATNVMGTVHLCQAARQVPGVRALLCITSDKCYVNREWDWAYRESDPLGGHDPYSASKAGAELVAASFRDAFFAAGSAAAPGTALATARAGNVIGGGDWSADRLLPDLLKAADEQRVVPIRRPEATRPWQHVLDALAGYLLLAERLHADGPAHAEAWNFGPGDGDIRSVRQVVEAVQRRRPLRVEFAAEPNGPHEAQALRLDSARARLRLGWQPAWGLDRALAQVIDWHTRWRLGEDPRRICLDQIDEHSRQAAGDARAWSAESPEETPA